MPRSTTSQNRGSGRFDSLKSRFGFGGNETSSRSRRNDYDDFDDEYADEDYEGEFAEYGESYQDDDGSRLEPYRPVSVRDTHKSGSTYPRLVSAGDVKARPTQAASSPYAKKQPTRTIHSYGGERTVVDNTAPAPSTPAHNAALRESQARSEGLDSLFQPTTGTAAHASAAPSHASTPGAAHAQAATKPIAPAPAVPVRPKPRSLSVLKPSAYSDVERIAQVVRSGDVVVLALRDTPAELARRILDFSFGVASALEASVESPAARVFAIATGASLTTAEKQTLHTKGVL